jgi:hypothetical protein
MGVLAVSGWGMPKTVVQMWGERKVRVAVRVVRRNVRRTKTRERPRPRPRVVGVSAGGIVRWRDGRWIHG